MTQVGPLLCLHFKHPVTWMLPHRYGKVGMKYHLNISFEEPPTCLPKKNHKNLHRPGIEPGPPAWQASILPLNQRCLMPISHKNIHTDCNFIFSPEAVVAEWLRRLTRNEFPSGSVGSNPTNCEQKSFQQVATLLEMCKCLLIPMCHWTYMRPCGLMDKAPDFGSGDCRFESCHGRKLQILFSF